MPQDIYDKIITMAKRRGFIYPSFEIYGGIAGFYDYGPLGAQLKLNIENLWRRYFVLTDNCVEITTPTITLFEVLKASGHVEEFTDLTVDCPKCKRSFKVEDIIGTTPIDEALTEHMIKCLSCGTILTNPHPVNLMFSTTIGIGDGRPAFLRPETAQGIFTNFHLLYRYHRERLPFGVVQIGKGYRNEISPRQGTLRQREFSMAEAEIFIDPQHKTHPNYHSAINTPLILNDNETEHHVTVDQAVKQKIIKSEALAYYLHLTARFLLAAGVDPKKFRFRKHGCDELAHYAAECWDAELYSERFGWIECVGIADRSAYDLNAHVTASGVDMYAVRKYPEPKIEKHRKITPKMDVFGPLFKKDAGKIKAILDTMEAPTKGPVTVTIDGNTITIPDNAYDITEVEEKTMGEKFIPNVIEPSFGIDRVLYFLIEHNYKEIAKKDEEYTILSLPTVIAPITTGVFPLTDDEHLVKLAEKLNTDLRAACIHTYYDTTGTIGRRYARMDEIGTPFCITIDHESLTDHKATIRDRDTTEQQRVPIKDIATLLGQKVACT
jgi:glycyl-tRNA synthetase